MKNRFKLKRSYAHALTVLILTVLVGCKSGGGSVSFGDSSPNLIPSSVPVNVIVHTGNSFSCFAVGHRIFCGGNSIDHDVALNTASYIEYVNDGDSDILSLRTWDNTICWTTSVTTRPYSGTPGVATYCVGQATLQNTNSEPVIYSGPSFGPTYGSADLTYFSQPMIGADWTLSDLINGNVITDTSSSVTSTLVTCALLQDSFVLSCPNFSVQL